MMIGFPWRYGSARSMQEIIIYVDAIEGDENTLVELLYFTMDRITITFEK